MKKDVLLKAKHPGNANTAITRWKRVITLKKKKNSRQQHAAMAAVNLEVKANNHWP